MSPSGTEGVQLPPPFNKPVFVIHKRTVSHFFFLRFFLSISKKHPGSKKGCFFEIEPTCFFDHIFGTRFPFKKTSFF